MFEDIKKIIKFNLVNSIDIYLKKYCYHYSSKCKNTLQEPDYIAFLAIEFPEILHRLLNKFLRPYNFSITGVFTHQKPIANFIDMSGSCEIGDLLIIYIFRDVKGIKHYNSLLLQAKISNTNRLNLNELDNQLILYTKWPKFYYSRAGIINGNERDVIPKTSMSGAKYLMINPDNTICNRNNPFEFIYGTAISNMSLVINNPFSVELVDFINFKGGRTFEERPKDISTDDWVSDEWSKMIWDMMDILKDKKSNRKNIGKSNFPRVTNAGDNTLYYIQHFNTYSLFDDLDNSFKNDYRNYENINCFGCIPMIIIEGQESEVNLNYR